MINHFIISAFVLLAIFQVNAQNCTPDPTVISNGVAGIFPNPSINPTLPNGTVNGSYATTITFVVDADTTIDLSGLIGFPFPPVTCMINYYEIVQVSTLPIGLNNSCEPVSCQFPGGGNGCMTIEGIPTVAGTSSIQVSANYNLQIPGTVPVIGGTSQNIPSFFAPYSLTILSDLGLIIPSKPSFQIFPNPSSQQLEIKSDLKIIDTRIINLEGEIIKHFKYTNSLNISDLSNGIYFIEITTDQGIFRQKIIHE
jgi:hypothetical protein